MLDWFVERRTCADSARIEKNGASGFDLLCILVRCVRIFAGPALKSRVAGCYSFMKMRSKMIRKRNIPAMLASTTLLILRNRLSERVWGSRGVYSPHISQPRPSHGPGIGLAACRPSCQEQTPKELPCRATPWPDRVSLMGSESSAIASRTNIGTTHRTAHQRGIGSRF